GHHAVRIESRIHVTDACQTLQQQSCPRQQHQPQRQFSSHQQRTEFLPSSASRRRPSRFPHRIVRIHFRHVPRRHASKNQHRYDSHQRREPQHVSVQRKRDSRCEILRRGKEQCL